MKAWNALAAERSASARAEWICCVATMAGTVPRPMLSIVPREPSSAAPPTAQSAAQRPATRTDSRRRRPGVVAASCRHVRAAISSNSSPTTPPGSWSTAKP